MEIWIIILISFLLSAFYSGSEAAFYSVNRLKLSIFKRKHHRGARLAIEFINSPSRYLAAILVGNNIANVLFGSAMAIALHGVFSETAIIFISTTLILIFSEILPKSISRINAEKIAMKNAPGVRISEVLFYPLIKFLSLITRFVSHYLGHESNGGTTGLSKKEISILFQESRYLGLIQSRDENFIQKVIQLNEVKARQVMRHRTEIQAVPVENSIEEVRQFFIRKQFTRLPVYEKNLDNIIGIVNSLDVLHAPANLQEIMRQVPFMPETKPVLSILQQLRRQQASMAIILDEYGGTAGLLTMEDIFEEIFGEIEDEHDDHGDFIEKLTDDEYRIRGRVEINELNERLDFNLPTGDYETIAGLVISRLGKIPTVGEHLDLNDCRIIITRATRTTVSMVRIQGTGKA